MKHHQLSHLLLCASALLTALILLSGCAAKPSNSDSGESAADVTTTGNPKIDSGEPEADVTTVGNLQYDSAGNFYLDKSDPRDYGNGERYTIMRIAEEMAEEKLPYYQSFKLHIGNGCLYIEDKSAVDSTITKNPFFVIKSAEAYGQTVHPTDLYGNTLNCYGNLEHTVLDIDSHFIFYVAFSGTEMGYTYIMGEEGVYEIEAPYIASAENISSLTEKSLGFYEEDGKLMFMATTNKFQVMQEIDNIYRYCTSKDECFREYGTVKFEKDAIRLTTQEVETVGERIEDFDEGYLKWREMENIDLSLDEYLRQNSEKYPTGIADKEIVLSPDR